MAIFNFFKKHSPILFRCTVCLEEKTLTSRQLRLVTKLCPPNPVCPFLIPCPTCHRGAFVPVDYTDDQGHRFLFDQIKPKINNPDPAAFTKGVFIDQKSKTIVSFKFDHEL